MNDIASELGISKKTLYKHVSNKAELVNACCMFSLKDVSEKIRELIGHSMNAIDELLLMDKLMRDKLETQLHIVEHQLRRHFPDEHQKLLEKRHQMILEVQRANLKRGISEGIYREDIDIEIVAQLYYSKIHGLLTQSAHKPLIPNLKELLGDALVYHIHGIATQKGIEYLNQRKSELGK
jgi:AcrR family transcriptional regulator